MNVKKTFTSRWTDDGGFQTTGAISAKRIVRRKMKLFRMQLLRGYAYRSWRWRSVGVAGHAGLFSNAYDLAMIMQMLLNGEP